MVITGGEVRLQLFFPPKALLRGRVCQVIPWLLLLRIMNMNFGDSVVISTSYI
jgi:hypothetical protein